MLLVSGPLGHGSEHGEVPFLYDFAYGARARAPQWIDLTSITGSPLFLC